MDLPVTERAPGVVRFTVRVQPRAASNAIVGVAGGALRVRLSAPPVDGAANSALLVFLAESLGVRPKSVTLVSGEGSRTKVIEVVGKRGAEVARLGHVATGTT